MIIKKRGSNVVLPEKYHIAQNVCDVLFAQLAEFLVTDIYKELSNTTFEFDKPYPNESNDVESLLNWLIEQGKHSQVATAISKRIMVAVLEDFLGFVSESMNAAKTAKFSVAYTLLRKPMLDELLMFEEILINKDDFAERYYIQGDISLYDPSSRKEPEKKRIISEAVNKVPMNFMFDADRLFEDRYDKNSLSGLNRVCNQATHIVTHDKRYRTDDRELNIVFANTDDYEKMWEHYYSILPRLLFYVVTVIDQVLYDFVPANIQRRKVKAYRRLLAYTMLGASNFKENKESFIELIEGFTEELQHTCKECNNDLQLSKEDLLMFALLDTIKCKSCEADQFADAEFVNRFQELE